MIEKTNISLARLEQKVDDLIIKVDKINGSVKNITDKHYTCSNTQTDLWGQQKVWNKLISLTTTASVGGIITLIVHMIIN